MKGFAASRDSLFYSSGDPQDPSLGDLFFHLHTGGFDDFVEKISLQQLKASSFLLAGYPDQDGLAGDGKNLDFCASADEVRKELFRFTPPYWSESKPSFVDIGGLTIEKSLAARHEEARRHVFEALSHGHTWIGLGGSFDYARADLAGFLEFCAADSGSNQKPPLVIHLTSHPSALQSRRSAPYRGVWPAVLTDARPPRLVQIGLSETMSPKSSLQYLGDHTAYCRRFQRDLRSQGLPIVDTLLAENDWFTSRAQCALCIDFSALCSSTAQKSLHSVPGGLSICEIIELMEVLANRLNPRLLGIYNVESSDTPAVKLAAFLIYRFLFR